MKKTTTIKSWIKKQDKLYHRDMATQQHSAMIIALAVTVLCIAGIFVSFSRPTLTGSAIGTHSSDPLIDEYRLVLITPHVGEAHRFITTHPEIEIKQEFETSYVALVPKRLIPQLKTMADVEFMNQ